MYMNQSWREYKPKKGLGLKINHFISSLTYFLVHSLIFFISYKIWGVQMFDKTLFYGMHLVSFYLLRVLLTSSRIWAQTNNH